MPEFYKKSDRREKNQWRKSSYFCHVGRTGGRSLIWNFIRCGWNIIQDDIVHPTREEVFSQYKSKPHDRIMPTESFAIVRHPIDRLVSHGRWAIEFNKLKNRDFFEYIDYSIDNMYDTNLGRQIIPAFDSMFFDATIIQYEIGHRKIADFLVKEKLIEKWVKNVVIREDSKIRPDWSKCPEKLRSKILKTYESDFETFEYDPYKYLIK